MMTRKKLNQAIRLLKQGASDDCQDSQDLIKILESIRDTQTTADGKIALRGDEVWLGDDFGGVFSERVYVSSDCTDKQISATYSSEAALKRAIKKASGK
jgi:hypothetical protein